MMPKPDRTNLLAKTCGALSLTAAVLTTGYPCHLLAQITGPHGAVSQTPALCHADNGGLEATDHDLAPDKAKALATATRDCSPWVATP